MFFVPSAGSVPIGGGNGTDKSKEWQMELLMEKLRSKGSGFKTLVETAKNLRMAMLVGIVKYFSTKATILKNRKLKRHE